MNYNEYKKIIERTPATEGIEYNLAVVWLHPEQLPLKVVSLNGCTDKVVRIPDKTVNRYGRSVPVISIGKDAFRGNTTVTDIILGAGIESIDAETFSGCTALERIIIPKRVTHIRKGTFAGCMVLKDIYYEGTSEEWEQITIDDKERVTEFGALTAGTPVQEVVSDRLVHIPGNEALRNADIHFRCDLNRT